MRAQFVEAWSLAGRTDESYLEVDAEASNAIRAGTVDLEELLGPGYPRLKDRLVELAPVTAMAPSLGVPVRVLP